MVTDLVFLSFLSEHCHRGESAGSPFAPVGIEEISITSCADLRDFNPVFHKAGI